MTQAGMVIVGAGECGARAGFSLREQGFSGPVTLIGAEPHLPYERPPLSKHAMLDEAPALKSIATAERMAEAGIRLIAPAWARMIDRANKTVSLEGGETVPYGKLLLAAGAAPRLLPLAAASRRCLYLRTYDDALAIRARLTPGARLLIVGGGFIGLELAASARRLGAAVTVVEAQPRILSRGVPAEIAAVIGARHEAEGVRLLCGAGLASIEDTPSSVLVGLADGSRIEADGAVIGVGSVPNAALAEAAGLDVGNGVAVDEHLRTSDPDILAAGDCCSFPLSLYGGRKVRLESWRNAQQQGALAAANMLGRKEKHEFVPWFWSDQYELGLQVAGLPEEGAETVRRDLGENAFILFHLAADGRLAAASGIGPGTAAARDIRVAEMLIAARKKPPRERLAAPDVKLKALLAA